MNVFISWSGERSRQVAELMKWWVQCIIQPVKPWVSTQDIDRGAIWYKEIATELAASNNGIVCLTKENLSRPWILFEAGAMAKSFESSRVYTFLIDLQPHDISDPLAQFNHTLPTEESLRKLAITINSSLGDLAVKSPILDDCFKAHWPKFEEKLQYILANTADGPAVPEKKEGEKLDDILTELKAMNRRLIRVEKTSDLVVARDKYPDSIPYKDFFWARGYFNDQSMVEYGYLVHPDSTEGRELLEKLHIRHRGG